MIKDNYDDDVIARFADIPIFIAPSGFFLFCVHGYQKSVGV